MTRKSKRQNNNNPFTYSEKQTSDIGGTTTLRLGSDSSLPFGYCPLSLSAITGEAVVSRTGGHIYEKEGILNYLVEGNRKCKELITRWEGQCRDDSIARVNESDVLERKRVKMFEENDSKVIGNIKADESASNEITAIHNRETQLKMQKGYNMQSKEEQLKSLKHNSFWLATAAPEGVTDRLEGRPPSRPNSPISGKSLKMKDLVKCNLVLSTQNSDSNSSKDDNTFICPLTLDKIGNSNTVLICKTGTLILEKAYKELVLVDGIQYTKKEKKKKDGKPSIDDEKESSSGEVVLKMIDPITGQSFLSSDVIVCKSRGGTGFAGGGGSVEVKSWVPSML